MLYRVYVDMAFENEADAMDIFDKAIDRAPDAIVINPGAINRESPRAQLLRCGHDDDPPTPCTILVQLYDSDS